jgi:serine/threonine protein kinase/tetratricopeptide (TPR) repeat protein
MNDSPQLLSIFCEARERRSAGERAAYLDEVCGHDAKLRARVEELLGVEPAVGSFLQGDGSEQKLADTDREPLAEGPGTLIGPYKLLEQIGEGGFGVVFMTEQQEPLRRKVALKVLKPGMDSRQVIARFEAERQALALMDHPNIADVFDGGQTATGRPYFVMELVRGIPITDFCDQNQLPVRQRLELFLNVCQAVQHAHHKGIIHRDIKPTNVLVTLQDSAPLVKVIDFGIAKALGQQLTDKTLFTNFAQMVGTPLYMSPEQAALSNVDVDTRSDIYALGVLLYELLTGTTPFEKERLGKAGYDELRRIIREEEPPRPSTRLSTLGQAAATVSMQRQSDPRRLSQLFRGELDWIVMKCLEKDRDRRYESASALAADVRRYLSDEPVLACPPSGLYRFRKFAWRYRVRLAAAGLLAGVVLAGVAGLIVSNVLISREKEEKDLALRQARANAEDAERQRRLAQANLQLARKAVDEVYEQFVGEFNSPSRHDQHLAQRFQQKTLTFYEEFARLQETDPELRFAVARAQVRVAEIHMAFQQFAPAEKALTQAMARLDALEGELASDPARRRELARACERLGYVLVRTQRRDAAQTVLRRAVGLLSPPSADSPADPADRYLLATVHVYLASVLRPDLAAAEAANRAAVGLADRLAADSPAVAYRERQVNAHLELGRTLAARHRYREAEASIRHALDLLGRPTAGWDTRPNSATARLQLAGILEATDRAAEAESACRQAIELLESFVRDVPLNMTSWDTLFLGYDQLARLLEPAGRIGEATDCHRRALDSLGRFVDALPPEEAYEALALNIMASFSGRLRSPGERPDRESLYRGALAAAERLAGKLPSRPGPRSLVAFWHGTLGSVHTARGRSAEAEAAYRQAVAGYQASLDLDPKRAPTLNNLAWLLATCPDAGLRDPPRALELAKRATELAPQYGYLWNTCGVAHYRAGEWDAARVALEKSIALYAGRPESDTLESFSTFFLAMAHARLGNGAEARRWYDRAVRWMEQTQPGDLELRRFRAEAEELLRQQKGSQENGR